MVYNFSCTKGSFDLAKACFIPYIDFVVYNVDPNTLEVNFSNIVNSNGTSITQKWEYGDGTSYIGPVTGKHTYPPLSSSNPSQKYKVRYTVSNECGTSYWSKEITVGPCLANVRFSTNYINDSTIQFSNQTTSATPVTYLWDFNDGTTSTSSSSITKVFKSNKTYNVILKAINSCGENYYLVPVIICRKPIIGAFTYNISNGNNVSLNASNSQLTTTYQFDYGNGVASSSQSSPIFNYKYPSIGNYTITLTASNTCGITSYRAPISITCLGIDSFVTSTPISEDLNFTYSGPIVLNATTYAWDFGDGTGSTNRIPPVKVYLNPGNFNVKYIASNTCSSYSVNTLISVPTTIAVQSNFAYQSVVTINSSLVYYLTTTGIVYQYNNLNNTWTSLGVSPITFDSNSKLTKDRSNNLWIYGTNGAAKWTGTAWSFTSSNSLGYSINAVLSDIDMDANNILWSTSGGQLRKGNVLITSGSTITGIKFSSLNGRIYFLMPQTYPNSLLYVTQTVNTVVPGLAITNMSGQSSSIEIDQNNGDIYFSSNLGFIRCDNSGNYLAYFSNSNTNGLTALPKKFVFDNRNNIWALLSNGQFLRIQKNVALTDSKIYNNAFGISNIIDFDILTISSTDNDIFLAKSIINGAARIK